MDGTGGVATLVGGDLIDEAGPDRGQAPADSRRRVLSGVGLVVLALPVLGYFAFIHHFALNILWGDSWPDINVIDQAHRGTLTLSTLWLQHNENRVFFPNLIVLLLSYTTHFNVVIEEYISAVALTVATGLLVVAHHRRSPDTTWLAYLPVVVLMFTLVGGNPYWGGGETLYGFDVGWYLVVVGLAFALFLFDRPEISWPLMVGAIAAGFVGSYSSIQGLMIWPAALLLLFLRRRPVRLIVVWIAAAVVCTAVFFVNYNSSYGYSHPAYALSHPLAAVKFFLFSIGDNILGAEVLTKSPDADSLVLGAVILVIASWVVIVIGLRRDGDGGSPLGVSLTVAGLLITGATTAGRVQDGYPTVGRYAMFELLVWVGCYLAILDQQPPLAIQLRRWYLRTSSSPREVAPTTWRGVTTAIISVVLVGLVVLQVILGTTSGLVDARAWHQREALIADVTTNIQQVPDGLLGGYLGGYYPPTQVRSMTAVARSQHLSLFDTQLATTDEHRGLAPTIVTSVAVPADGAILSGTTVLAALNLDRKYSVEFEVIGGAPRSATVVGEGTPILFGSALRWNTLGVANGAYVIQSVLVGSHGPVDRSAPVWVHVRNR